jgi:hypothetical protein
MQKEIVKI